MKRCCGLLVVTAGLLLAADEPKQGASKKAAKDELAHFQGTWHAVSWEENGDKRSADDVKKVQLIVKGDQWTLKNGDDELRGTMKVDPTTTPKHFDATTDSGDTVQGIYELKGNQLKQCWAAPGQDRPKSFSAKADSGHTLVTLMRGKSGRKNPSRGPAADK